MAHEENHLHLGGPAAVGPYSQAIRVGNFVFCSGQILLDPELAKSFPATLMHKRDE